MPTRSRRLLVPVLLLSFLAACSRQTEEQPSEGEQAAICQGLQPGNPVASLDCPVPPDTFPTTALVGAANGKAWDAWAWSSFAALNWPALASADASTYPSGFVRGVPDTTKSFATAQPEDVAVWETFKEKREIFNPAASPGAWQQLTFDPTYAPDFNGGQIQMCAGTDLALLEQVKARPRVIAQLSKQAPSIDGASSTDETAEVASPPQESTNTLCAGLTGNALEGCRSFAFPPPPGGTLDTPYTAAGPNSRQPVGPRVFKGTPAQENFVYYEVKLNYDYYAYVAKNGYGDYDTAVAAAKTNQIRLPFRTSAISKPGPNNPDSVINYSSAKVLPCYQSQLKNCSLPGQSISPAVLPALGSIQVKAAWLPASRLGANPAAFHLTSAVYYQDSPQQPNGLCYGVQQFGLIGLHIIQRVHGGRATTSQIAGAASPEPIGGTYIFATWEHESIADGAGYSYVNYFADAGNEQKNPQPYPNTATGIPLSRLQAYPLPATAALDQQVKAQLPNSVWKNYRLIGTQFQAIGNEADSAALGQPYYLANLVIETNRGLQQFQGQPPGLQPNAHFKANGVPENYQFFSPTAPNMTFGGGPVVMGGCMGCHGVAQVQGFAFSFVLQDGSKGTKPDTAGTIAIPPIRPPSSD